jgi:hypothetical protein
MDRKYFFTSPILRTSRQKIKTRKYYDYHLPEDDNHHSHRRGNLKSYKEILVSIQYFILKQNTY